MDTIKISEESRRGFLATSAADKGCHFATWEQPELFAAELRGAFT
jgi:hypothetical protein